MEAGTHHEWANWRQRRVNECLGRAASIAPNLRCLEGSAFTPDALEAKAGDGAEELDAAVDWLRPSWLPSRRACASAASGVLPVT